jgi:transforming growth factor-beta-induced protein
MGKNRFIVLFLSLVALTSLLAGCMTQGAKMADKPAMNIVQIASGDSRFSTLVTAVKAAGLVDALSGAGPFTVFAPTDAAFAKLGQAAINNLLANPDKLKSILLYHVVGQKLPAAAVVKLPLVTTLNGADALLAVKAGNVSIDNATVTATDIMASNGVIHVIDTVILPPSMDIVDTAVSAGSFKTLVAAVKAAGLVDTLKSAGPFTVFAPTDAAFAKLGQATIENLLANPDKLKSILLYHVAAKKLYASKVVAMPTIATVNGASAKISMKNGEAYIDNAMISTTDIMTTNGVIHVIDTVILPPA